MRLVLSLVDQQVDDHYFMLTYTVQQLYAMLQGPLSVEQREELQGRFNRLHQQRQHVVLMLGPADGRVVN